MITFQGAYSEILNYDWEDYEMFIEEHSEYNLDKEIISRYKHSGIKIDYETYKDNYKKLKKEFDDPDNSFEDFETFLKVCRMQGWQI